MDLTLEIKHLLLTMGAGTEISASAYDTAWIARLKPVDETLSATALTWLRENQLPDGSWGAVHPVYFHDRVICTLSALIALAMYGDANDRKRIANGRQALEKWWGGLQHDLSGETIAFEMLVPTLLEEAHRTHLSFGLEHGPLDKLRQGRDRKLSQFAKRLINRHVTLTHSSEMLGADGLHLLDQENLLEPNGSVGHSPAATASYLLHQPDREAARAYLHHAMKEGSVPPVTPIDVFERGWVLWNLALTSASQDHEIHKLIGPHLDFLEAFWHPEQGIGFASAYAAKDADGTSVVQRVLTHYGRATSIDPVLYYEEDQYFRCFSLEANYSTSANIHVLDSLLHAGLVDKQATQKVLAFLTNVQHPAGFWSDKWHASPYYTTSHAMIALSRLAHPSVKAGIHWMLSTQNKEGAWGFYLPTAEETAYSLSALAVCKMNGYPIPKKAIQRGATWLLQHVDPPYPPLWIGKCLYTPINVIRATILSALLLAEAI